MKNLFLLFMLLLINCEKITEPNLPTNNFDMSYSYETPDMLIKALKIGQYFIDPINKNLCERRDDIPNQKYRYLEGKCLPIKTKKFSVDRFCEEGSDRFFIDTDNLIHDIKITEKDGKFYKAYPIIVPIKALYEKKRFCEEFFTKFPIYVITANEEVFPTFPSLP
jgi:hypothetical protein